MDLLLDSHALLWTLYTPAVLPSRLAGLLQDPTTHLYISEGSVWELSDKAAKGRLPLAGNSVSGLMHDIEQLSATLLPIERADIWHPSRCRRITATRSTGSMLRRRRRGIWCWSAKTQRSRSTT